jgi:hypothetical protein
MASDDENPEQPLDPTVAARALWEAPDVRSLDAPDIEAGSRASLPEGVDDGYGNIGSAS